MVLREQASQAVAALISWASGVQWTDIPDAARRRAALICGDDIAACLSAQDEPEVRAYHEGLIAAGRSGRSSLLRKGAPKLAARDAAAGNGLAISWNEVDEGYRRSPCHAGAYLLPALLAVAEEEDLTVGEVLRAATVAYEITARFARCWQSAMPPMHPHGIFNAIGAAAAVALAGKVDARILLRAVTGASTMVSPGPYDHAIQGVLVRNAWAAAGAQIGMMAVDLARVGVGGIASSPYDVYAGGFRAQTQVDELTHGLGADWAVCDGYHKLYACCQYAHASLDAVADILHRRPELKGGDAIASIAVEADPRGMTLCNDQPATTLAAKFSLPHAVAAALVYGDAGVASFSSASLADPDVARLRAAVALRPHPGVRPWPNDRPGRVTLTLKSGEQLAAACDSARGGPDRPFHEDEIAAKIRALSASSAPGLADAIVSMHANPELPLSAWLRTVFR